MSRRYFGAEVVVVLGLSLGTSALYSVVSLIAKLTAGPLKDATATLNSSRSARPYLDLTYQLLGNLSDLVPVALVLLLMATLPSRLGSVWKDIGLDGSQLLKDLVHGAGLAIMIGLPGLALYFAGRYAGITAAVIPAETDRYWWSLPMLCLAAFKNGALEEVIMIAYLSDRLPRMGISPAAAVATSALLRGAYHLYQGFGAFFGNAVMGVAFWWYYLRTHRVLPLVIAHTLLDVVAFVGYALLADVVPLP